MKLKSCLSTAVHKTNDKQKRGSSKNIKTDRPTDQNVPVHINPLSIENVKSYLPLTPIPAIGSTSHKYLKKFSLSIVFTVLDS